MYKQKYEIVKNIENQPKVQEPLNELKGDHDMILNILDSLMLNQQEILEKLSGSNIGKVQERLTIMELKSTFPNDNFSDEESDKHGTDIIATVLESGIEFENISISVKHQNRWSSEFVSQLEKNIEDDCTRWGFLVTSTFPSDALNNNIWTAKTSSGRLILLVKPQFASIAYYAIRTIVLYEYQLRKILTTKNERFLPGLKNLNIIGVVKNNVSNMKSGKNE